MIKQILTVAAIVGLMSSTAMAQSSGSSSSGSAGGGSGSQNLNTAPATKGGTGNANTTIGGSDSSTGVYRDAQGKPCTAGSAGCMREDSRSMKKQ